MDTQYFICFRGDSGYGGAIGGNVYKTLHEKHGYNVYFSSAPDRVKGLDYREDETKALNKASGIILVLTNDFFDKIGDKDDEVRFELETAFARKDLEIYVIAHSSFDWSTVDLNMLGSIIGEKNTKKLSHTDYVKYTGQRDYYDITEKQLCQSMNINFSHVASRRGTQSLICYLKSSLKNRCEHTGSYNLGEITSVLYPTLGNIKRTIVINDDNLKESSMISLLLNNKSKDYLMIGDGGIGKTVLLFEIGKELLKLNIPTIYVPLHEVADNLDLFINNFFGQKVQDKKIFYDSDHSVLLLDGFNEVADGIKHEVLKSIGACANREGIQILLTSRYDPRQIDMMFNGFDLIKLNPLTGSQIDQYLKSCNIDIKINQKMQNILSYPLMLTLYTNSMVYNETHGMHDALLWRDKPATNGEIIWNFLQTQLQKSAFELGSKKTLLDCIFSIEYVLPFIGYVMYKTEKFYISQKELLKAIELALDYYRSKWEDKYPDRIDDLMFFYDDLCLTYNKRAIYRTLVHELNILNKNVNKNYTFFHQNLRDCLAAIHLINCAENSDDFNEWREWLDINVIKLIHELMDKSVLDHVLEEQRNIELNSDDLILANVINVYSLWLAEDFRSFDFSGLDLSNISLREYSIEEAIFNNAKLSPTTFLQRGHFDSIMAISNSQNKDVFFTASKDGTIMIWDLLNATFVDVLTGHSHVVTSLTFKDSELLSASKDKTIRKWDMDTCTDEIVYTHHNAIIKIIYWSDYLFLLDDADTLYCYEGDSVHWKTDNVISFDVHQEKGSIAVYKKDKHLIVFYEGFSESFNMQTKGECSSLLFSIYIDVLFVGRSDGGIQLIHLDAGKANVIGFHDSKINSIIELNDKLIATSSDDNSIFIWNYGDGSHLTLKDHYKAVLCLCHNKVRNILISGSTDNCVKLWNASDGTLIKTIEGYTNWVNCVQKSADSNTLMTASGDNTVRIWDYKSFKWLHTFKEHSGWVYSCAISASGKYGVSGAGDGYLVIMDLINYDVNNKEKIHSQEIRHLEITNDEKKIVTCGLDGYIHCFDLVNKQIVDSYDFKAKIYRFKLSADGNKALVGCSNDSIYLYDIINKEVIWEIKQAMKDGVRSIATSTDFTRGWCGGKNNYILEIDIVKGEISKNILCDTDTKTLACDSEKELLAISGVSGLIEVRSWDNEVVFKSTPINGEVRMLDFVEENIIMSGGTDSRICFTNITNGHVEDIRPGELLNINGCKFVSSKYTHKRLRDIIKENNGIME